VWC
jgi:hypothetical protein